MGEEDIIRNDEENSKIIENYQNEMKDYSDQELDEQEMSEDREGEDGEEEENILIEQEEEENNEEQKNLKKKNKKLFLNKTVDNCGNETKLNLNEQFKSIESVAADLLASIGRQQMQNNSLGDEGRNNCGIEFCKDFFVKVSVIPNLNKMEGNLSENYLEKYLQFDPLHKLFGN